MGAITLLKCVMILMGVFFIIGGAIHAMVSFADAAERECAKRRSNNIKQGGTTMTDNRIKEEDRMQCTCGQDVSKRWHFCPKCGKPIQSNEAGEMNSSIK